jgi:hypothetical protein
VLTPEKVQEFETLEVTGLRNDGMLVATDKFQALSVEISTEPFYTLNSTKGILLRG